MEFRNPQNQNNEEDKIPIFMDIIAYTVIYNENNEIVDIINHTQKNISEDQIKKTAENILKQNNKINTKVGNLYFDDYSYSFKGQNVLTIIDNQMAQKKLINLLRTSIIIFVFLEIAILILSLKITGWIIKPVIKTFNMQKQFIADASHELKTPVAVIMANADALEKEPNEVKWLNNIES